MASASQTSEASRQHGWGEPSGCILKPGFLLSPTLPSLLMDYISECQLQQSWLRTPGSVLTLPWFKEPPRQQLACESLMLSVSLLVWDGPADIAGAGFSIVPSQMYPIEPPHCPYSVHLPPFKVVRDVFQIDS